MVLHVGSVFNHRSCRKGSGAHFSAGREEGPLYASARLEEAFLHPPESL